MRKLFFDCALSPGREFVVSGDNFRHLRVLRARASFRFMAGDPEGKEYIAEILCVGKNTAQARVLEVSDSPPEPLLHVVLYAALAKNSRFEDIVFRCSQVGVSEFVPVITERTERPAPSSGRFYVRCEKKARHGSEISGRSRVPDVRRVLSFKEALESLGSSDIKKGIIFWEEEKTSFLEKEDRAEKVAIFTGPEGGFTSGEVAAAREASLVCRSLGPLVMDVETACVASSALLLCPGP